MMIRDRCDQFTRILRRRDPRLFVAPLPSVHDPSRPVLWVQYQMSGQKPIKLTTIDALDAVSHGTRSPGSWVLEELDRVGWKHKITNAKRQLARDYAIHEHLGATPTDRVLPHP